MKQKFCIKCGKKTDKLFDGLCEKCFLEKKELIEVPKRIVVNICKNCGRVQTKRGWSKGKSIEDIVKKKIKTKNEIEKIKITKKKVNKDFVVEILATGKISGLEKTERRKTIVVIRKKLCEMCGKISGGYYEAIIQLRSDEEEKIMNSAEIIKNILKNKNGFLTKIVKRKNGIDLYITPKSLVDIIIKNIPKIKEKKKSYSLATRKDGRDLYRTTALVRL